MLMTLWVVAPGQLQDGGSPANRLVQTDSLPPPLSPEKGELELQFSNQGSVMEAVST